MSEAGKNSHLVSLILVTFHRFSSQFFVGAGFIPARVSWEYQRIFSGGDKPRPYERITISWRKWLQIFFIVIAAFFTADAPLQAAEPADFRVSFIPKPWEVNVERSYMTLDKDWRFFKGAAQKAKDFDSVIDGIVDPKYFVLRGGQEIPLGKKCDHPEAADCDDSSWIKMDVPFNWIDLGKEMDEFRGTAWYRKNFDAPPGMISKGRAVLKFEGVFYRAWVYLNGEKVGFHEGGYTPFSFDVTRLIKPGANLLAVRVNNVIEQSDFAIGDWWNYGGIHREVYLEFTSGAHISDLSVKTKLSDDLKSAETSFSADVAGAGAGRVDFLVYRLGENDEKVFVKKIEREVDSTGKAIGNWQPENPALWSPEAPNLYFVKAVLYKGNEAVDGLGSVFGIRKFEVRGLELYLNNKKVFFRGVNRHDEFYHGEFPDGGRVMSEEERISDFRAIKEMGGNAMRTAHYPNHPYNYFITDRLGIMTVEEGGAVSGPLDDDAYIGKVKVQLEEMHQRDKNHPSILIWSIGNEFGGDKYLKYIKAAADHMRALDDRPLTFTETGGCDVRVGYKYVDILSRNEYAGWYGTGLMPEETPENLRDFILRNVDKLLTGYHADHPDKPVFIMETGAESICGQHAKDPELLLARGDEEYQEHVLKNQFAAMLEKDYVVGAFPWILSDFKTRKASGTCQFTPNLNRKGVLCADRTKKRAFFLVKQVYEELAEKYK